MTGHLVHPDSEKDLWPLRGPGVSILLPISSGQSEVALEIERLVGFPRFVSELDPWDVEVRMRCATLAESLRSMRPMVACSIDRGFPRQRAAAARYLPAFYASILHLHPEWSGDSG